jgi:hypothetical protein
VPAPLTDRELLIAQLVHRDTLNVILEFARGAVDVKTIILRSIEKPDSNQATLQRVTALLAEHERIEKAANRANP